RLFYRHRAMVTAAPSARDEIIEHYGTDPSCITVVPHGIAPRFQPGGTKADHPLVVAVGRMMPQKGWDDLLPVLAEVQQRVPRLEAVIVGDGPQRESLESLAADLGATEWLRFVGRVTDDE